MEESSDLEGIALELKELLENVISANDFFRSSLENVSPKDMEYGLVILDFAITQAQQREANRNDGDTKRVFNH